MESSTPKSYGQFCPVAIASEILTQRWTPLVLRELLVGSTRFNDLRRGVPLMSPSLLAQRLRALEEAGIVARHSNYGGRQTEYRLTEAGEALRPIIEQIGAWGRRWVQHDIEQEQLDPGLLMWDMQRRIDVSAIPPGRTVVHFHFVDVEADVASWWLVLEGAQADVCLSDPGFSIDVRVTTTLLLMTEIWMGDADFRRAVGPELKVEGPRALVRALPDWFHFSTFAPLGKLYRDGANARRGGSAAVRPVRGPKSRGRAGE